MSEGKEFHALTNLYKKELNLQKAGLVVSHERLEG